MRAKLFRLATARAHRSPHDNSASPCATNGTSYCSLRRFFEQERTEKTESDCRQTPVFPSVHSVFLLFRFLGCGQRPRCAFTHRKNSPSANGGIRRVFRVAHRAAEFSNDSWPGAVANNRWLTFDMWMPQMPYPVRLMPYEDNELWADLGRRESP